jgi:hypothetical protein
MTIGFLYQLESGEFKTVDMKAPLKKYVDQAAQVINIAEKIVCRWVVKNKPCQ